MTDLFTTDNTNTNNIDPNKDYLTELVGEGKKYSDVAALARSRVEADQFIERLKSETQGLRTELQTRTTLEEVLDKLSNPERTQPPTNSNNQQSETEATALKPEDIAKLVDERVSERERARAANANLESAKRVLAQAYGNDYAQRLYDETSSLGLSKDYVNNLAQTAPKALFKLLGIDETASQKPTQRNDLFVPPQSQVRTNPTSSVGNDRNEKYYQDLRRKDPNTYWSTKVQNQMHQDALRLGESFFT